MPDTISVIEVHTEDRVAVEVRVAGPQGATGSIDNVEDNAGTINAAVRSFATVAAMLASEADARGEGWIWTAAGYRYEEAASDASDHHLTTAGGVKLYVLPCDGRYNAKAFGARGVAFDQDDQPAIQATIRAAANAGCAAYIPAGQYLLAAQADQCSVTGMTRDLAVYGDGPTTVLKRADGTVTTSFRRMLLFQNASGSSVAVTVRDMTLDGNARGNGIPYPLSGVTGTFVAGETVSNGSETFTVVKVDGSTIYIYETAYTDAPNVFDGLAQGDTITGQTSGATATISSDPGAYVYQQSHCLSVASSGARGFRSVEIRDIHIKDATADGVNIGGNSSNTFGDVVIRGVVSSIRHRPRSDVTITGCYDALMVSSCVLDKYEQELNAYTTTHAHRTVISEVVARVWFDVVFDGTSDLGMEERPSVLVSALVVDGLFKAGGANFTFFGPVLRLAASVRLLDGRYDFIGGSTLFGVNGADFTPTKGYYSDGTDLPESVRFTDHEFRLGDGASLTEYYSNLNAFPETAEVYEWIGCKFIGAGPRSATVRSGRYRFVGCRHDHSGAAITYGDTSASGVTNSLEARGNIVTHEDGFLLACPGSGNVIRLSMSGNVHEHAKSLVSFNAARVASPRGSGSLLNFVEVDDYVMAAEPSSGGFLKGQRVRFPAPDAGGSVGVQCTTTGAAGSTAVFKSLGALSA